MIAYIQTVSEHASSCIPMIYVLFYMYIIFQYKAFLLRIEAWFFWQVIHRILILDIMILVLTCYSLQLLRRKVFHEKMDQVLKTGIK